MVFYLIIYFKEKRVSKITLTIEVDTDTNKCVIRNYFNGVLDETYRPTSVERGVVDMTALILGYRPPRVLESRDIPAR